jgi:hypothetical protein
MNSLILPDEIINHIFMYLSSDTSKIIKDFFILLKLMQEETNKIWTLNFNIIYLLSVNRQFRQSNLTLYRKHKIDLFLMDLFNTL